MANTPTSIHIAQAIGITTSAFLSGATLALSYYAVPSLLQAPTPLLLRQWRAIYNRGKKSGPPMSILAGLSYAYLAYHKYYNNTLPLSSTRTIGSGGSGWELYATAAVLTMSIAPYTFAFMLGTNAQLYEQCEQMEGFAIGEEVEVKGKRENARQLLDWWGVLNAGRGIGPLFGALVGVWASVV